MTEIFICEPHILRSIAIPIFFDKWRSISISLFALYNWDLFSTSNMLTFLHIIVCFSCYLMLLSLSLSLTHTHTHTHTHKQKHDSSPFLGGGIFAFIIERGSIFMSILIYMQFSSKLQRMQCVDYGLADQS